MNKDSEDYLKANKSSLEHVHEYIKIRATLLDDKNNAKFEDLAAEALDSDPKKNFKVEVAENLHRRLVKLGLSGDKFKQKAK